MRAEDCGQTTTWSSTSQRRQNFSHRDAATPLSAKSHDQTRPSCPHDLPLALPCASFRRDSLSCDMIFSWFPWRSDSENLAQTVHKLLWSRGPCREAQVDEAQRKGKRKTSGSRRRAQGQQGGGTLCSLHNRCVLVCKLATPSLRKNGGLYFQAR